MAKPRACITARQLQKITSMPELRDIKNTKENHSNILLFGGSGVIGRAIATEFGNQGWSVGIHYHHNRQSAEETAATINKTAGDAQTYQANVHDPSQIRNIYHSFLQDHGSLTLLIWAVGVAPSKLLTKTTADEWGDTVQTNLTGAFYILREAGSIFEKQRDGAVILIGSRSGEQGMTGQAAYAASKAGLMGLMRTAAQEWGGWNIQVNAIFPGWHSSPLSGPWIDSVLEHQTHILNRTSSLDLMAKSVYHLASTRDISGQVWNLDSRL
ncbi:MAG: SDR family NAD(P)-dependent oxidoreductase [Nitrospirales bacterium]|nr:MAG: SDR family NAD(P)-dependent oxidoreductase [Nitrospirales bacterium]